MQLATIQIKKKKCVQLNLESDGKKVFHTRNKLMSSQLYSVAKVHNIRRISFVF